MVLRYVGSLIVVGAIALGLPAHAATKAEQCNSLAAPLMKLEPTVDKLNQDGKDFERKVQAASKKGDVVQVQSLLREYAPVVRDLSKNLTELSTEIGGVPLQDATLVRVKSQYLEALTGLNREVDRLASTLDIMGNSQLDTPIGMAEFQKAANSLDGSDSRVKDLVKQGSDTEDRFKAYCGSR